MRVIIDILREQKKTLIMVTHDPHIADFGDKIIRLLDGHITDIEINPKREEYQNEPEIRKTEVKKDA
ncbi:hypothetical protein SDC9_140125 [bioreactor metagenome]|uniref:Macrolide export ATP-binding/permease protein MacB n=1 Tax=bioreactor metagenome TaxID=1076179 RepID=A0A645DUM3_9ZZZZ